jgi:voltage-gated potassium channel
MSNQLDRGRQGIDRVREAQAQLRDVKRREDLLDRVERMTELPLLALAFVMIPLLLGPFLWELSPGEEAAFLALDSFIWIVFAVDLAAKTIISPHRKAFLKKHWLEVLIVVVPFFRPFRLLRLFIFGSRAYVGARRLVHVDFLIVYGIGLIMIVATVVTTVERDAEGSQILTFPDALWWSVVTISTVGYGDMVPVTTVGKTMAAILMLGGIAFFAGVAGNFAASITRRESSSKDAVSDLTEEIKKLHEEIASLQEGRQSGIQEGEAPDAPNISADQGA